MFQVESFWLKVQSSECGLPDFVIQAGLSPAFPIATCWRAFVTRASFLPSTCTH